MDTPRKLRLRPDPGDVVDIIHAPGDRLIIKITPAAPAAGGKPPPGPGVIHWTDRLRCMWESITDEGQSRKAIMERSGYESGSSADKLFRRLARLGLILMANGLVRRNPDAPPHLLP